MNDDDSTGAATDHRRRLVLVAGVGRTGTSLFTSILATAGFHVPQPEVAADPTNPKGFGEPRWAVDFHSRQLRSRRVSVWDSRPAAWAETATAADDPVALAEVRGWLEVQFVGRTAVVVKDPRIVWFLPLWQRAAEELGIDVSFAALVRHPAEAVGSALKWYGDWQTPASRMLSWVNIMLETERATRGRKRVFVRYDNLLDAWPEQVARAAAGLEVPFLHDLSAGTRAAVDDLVDPSLHRQKAGFDDIGVPTSVQRLASSVWHLMLPLTDQAASPEGFAALDAAGETYREFYAEAEAIAQSSLHALRPQGEAARTATTAGARSSSPARRGGGGADAAIRLAERFVPRRMLRRVPPVWRARLVRWANRAGRLVSR